MSMSNIVHCTKALREHADIVSKIGNAIQTVGELPIYIGRNNPEFRDSLFQDLGTQIAILLDLVNDLRTYSVKAEYEARKEPA